MEFLGPMMLWWLLGRKTRHHASICSLGKSSHCDALKMRRSSTCIVKYEAHYNPDNSIKYMWTTVSKWQPHYAIMFLAIQGPGRGELGTDLTFGPFFT